MPSTAIPDARALVPLQCPISTYVLKRSSALIRVVFAMINEARLNGSLGDLADARGMIESEPPERRHAMGDDGPLDRGLALGAALGDCLSIEGRWTGDVTKLQHGVTLIQSFVDSVDQIDLKDQGATKIRAHAYLGNALTRLAYRTKKHETLLEAVDQIEGQQKKRRDHRRTLNPFPGLRAAIHRDLGDAHVGQAHWSPAVEIDGAAIESLTAASMIFEELFQENSNDIILDEWAATESSLAVAQAKTAEHLLRKRTKANKLLKGRKRREVGRELLDAAEKTGARIWRLYLGLLSRPGNHLPFRWARTISNVAFASSYVYMLDPDRTPAAAMSEMAFTSVIHHSAAPPKRAITTNFDDIWYGDLLERAARYRQDDHPYRYDVNCDGLHDLHEAMTGS